MWENVCSVLTYVLAVKWLKVSMQDENLSYAVYSAFTYNILFFIYTYDITPAVTVIIMHPMLYG